MPFPTWTTEPIPGVSLSAGGLLALADLSTIAQRTAIAGGSSWLDSIVLVPGLHYNQAADQLAGNGNGGGPPSSLLSAVETLQDGQSLTFPVRNAATANYIRRISRPGQTVTLDVGCLPNDARSRFRLKRSASGKHATLYADADMPDLGWVSHALYLASPVLTVVAFAFMLVLRDWWSLASLVGLMLARVLNIWVIKQRSRPSPPHHRHPQPPSSSPSSSPDKSPDPSHRLTEYLVSLDSAYPSKIRLRGTPDDLAAITSQAWLRAKTHVEGYLEAAAKLIVYLVACLSGNMTQVGALIFMGLLLVSAGLLALSNAHAKGYRMNGRVAAVLPEGDEGEKRKAIEGVRGDPPYPVKRGEGGGEEEDGKTSSWPGSSDVSGYTGMDDWAEKGRVGTKPSTF
ncbi:hypothetical protein CONLIGDRAFT_306516 [Coniochaeta ligniaria NRRL 30616]|uniref:Uncharacterized protein n=1 Tax=Coniochaeta ligniaria NRRL 30616 TaxID=1408157 RepID=A0A1J7JPF8_9PEZI|nr:hypothetical protein CONLIGDRAFT_306516 [Coniochaeta ligniaria NRRL 30616]